MFCSRCGNKLKNNELFCSRCGNKIEETGESNTNNKQVKEKKKLNWWQTIIAIIISIIIGVFAIFIISKIVASSSDRERAYIHNASVEAGQRNKEDSYGNSTVVSYDKYEKIKDGMSYEKVCEIFEVKGEFENEIELNGVKTVNYIWKTNNNRKIYLTFSNNKLTTKMIV